MLCTFAAAAKAVWSPELKVSSAICSSSTSWFVSSEAMTVSFNPSEPRRFDDLEREDGTGVDVAGGGEVGGEVGWPAEVPGLT